MMKNDDLVFCILKLCPALQHGRDFWVAHPVSSNGFVQTGEAWIVEWKATDTAQPTQEEIAAVWATHGNEYQNAIAAAAARATRGTLLIDADNLVERAIDAEDGAGEKAARAYRKALRDVPNQPGFPSEIVWPVAPRT